MNDSQFDRDPAVAALTEQLRAAAAQHLRQRDFAALVADDIDGDAVLDAQQARARSHLRSCESCGHGLVLWVLDFIMSRQPSPVDKASELSTVDLLWLLDHGEAFVRAAALRAVPLLETWADSILFRVARAQQDADVRVRSAASDALRLAPAEAATDARDPVAATIAAGGDDKTPAPVGRWAAMRAALIKELRELIIPEFLKEAALVDWPLAGVIAGPQPKQLVQHRSRVWSVYLTEFGQERVVQIAAKAPELAGVTIDVKLGGRRACTMVLEPDGDAVRAVGIIAPELRKDPGLKPGSLEITVSDRESEK